MLFWGWAKVAILFPCGYGMRFVSPLLPPAASRFGQPALQPGCAPLQKPCLIPEGYTCIWYLFTVYLGMILEKKSKFPGEQIYLLFIWIHLFWNCCGPIHVAAVDGILIHFGWMTSERVDGSSIDVQLPPVACGWSEHNVGSKAYVM